MFLFFVFLYISANYFWFSDFKYYFYDIIYSDWPRNLKLILLSLLLLLVTLTLPIYHYITSVVLLLVLTIPFYLIEVFIFDKTEKEFDFFKKRFNSFSMYSTFIFSLFTLIYAINTGNLLSIKIWDFEDVKSSSYSYSGEKRIIEQDKIIQIGDKEWTTINLNTFYFSNDAPIFHARTVKRWKDSGSYKNPAWCFYDNSSFRDWKNGKLYNWYAVEDSRGICPTGWRVPTDEDWINLYEFFSDKEIESEETKIIFGWPILSNYKYKKSYSIKSGYRENNGNFIHENSGLWWSSSVVEDYSDSLMIDNNYEKFLLKDRARAVLISSEYDEIIFLETNRNTGIPVRCVRDIDE